MNQSGPGRTDKSTYTHVTRRSSLKAVEIISVMHPRKQVHHSIIMDGVVGVPHLEVIPNQRRSPSRFARLRFATIVDRVFQSLLRSLQLTRNQSWVRSRSMMLVIVISSSSAMGAESCDPKKTTPSPTCPSQFQMCSRHAGKKP